MANPTSAACFPHRQRIPGQTVLSRPLRKSSSARKSNGLHCRDLKCVAVWSGGAFAPHAAAPTVLLQHSTPKLSTSPNAFERHLPMGGHTSPNCQPPLPSANPQRWPRPSPTPLPPQWLRSNRDARGPFEAVMDEVERQLGVGGPPYFLSGCEGAPTADGFGLVDIMFAPFLERIAASLPYFKVPPSCRGRGC